MLGKGSYADASRTNADGFAESLWNNNPAGGIDGSLHGSVYHCICYGYRRFDRRV